MATMEVEQSEPFEGCARVYGMSQKAKKSQSLNLLIYPQVIEPTEKDQGKYSIVIVDPENSHKRTLDLSGEGMLSVSHHLHTL